MKAKTTYVTKLSRRSKGRTDYRKRLRLLKSRLPRLVIRKTNRRIIAQVFEFSEKGDKLLCQVDSMALRKFGWPALLNTPTAYLTGLYLSKVCKVKKCVPDIKSTPSKGAIMFAALKGAHDGGMDVPYGESKVIEERIRGEHIAKGPEIPYYKKEGIDQSKLPELFDMVKSKIGEKNG
ncbi:MAG: 50S ribosomal protein L18 [Candidatus Anstonellales archaeon]